ncbi:hypothetical protein ACWX0O_01795 [Nitrobacteraceae bacterium UC4449_H16]
MDEEEYIECCTCGEDVPEIETDGMNCEGCLEREHERQERPY